jgi:hypothetical protein
LSILYAEIIFSNLKKLRWHMERIDNKLGDSGGPWVCSGLFSLADIGFAGIDDRIEYRDRK